MTMLSLHRRSLLGFVSLGPLGLISGSPTLLASGLFVLALILRALGNFGTATPSLFARVAIHALTAMGLVGSLLLFRTDRVDAVLLILLLGLTNRLLLRAGQRDDFLLIALTSTMIAAATTVTPGIEFLLIVLAAVPTLVLALWSSELLGAVENDPIELARTRRRPSPGGMGRWVLIAVLMTLVGTALCTLFPRYKFSRRLSAGAFVRLPGASDAMRLDDGGTSDEDDDTVVIRVHPDADVGFSELQGLYARLHILEDFDGTTWKKRPSSGAFRALRTPISGARRVRVQVTRQTLGSDHPVAELGREVPFASHSPHLKWAQDGQLWSGIGRDRQVEYQVSLDTEAKERRPAADPGSTSLPEDLDPRLRRLSEQLVNGAASDRVKIDRVLEHFGRGYRYSTEPLEGTEDDPLVRFVFESKAGHCELYAAAVAVLLRAAGVPARVATGYYGGRWNRVGDYLAFVQGDAHAWVEVWSEAEARWRWVDATPEDLRGRRASLDVWALARDWYDTVSALWYERVVDFDGQKQKRLYGQAMDRLAALSAAWRGDDGARALSGRGGIGRGMVLTMGGGVLVAFLVVPAFVFTRRRRSPRALGLRLRRALGADLEVDRSATLGQLLGRQPEDARRIAETAIRRYEQLRFGSGAPEQIGPLMEALRALEKKKQPNPKSA